MSLSVESYLGVPFGNHGKEVKLDPAAVAGAVAAAVEAGDGGDIAVVDSLDMLHCHQSRVRHVIVPAQEGT